MQRYYQDRFGLKDDDFPAARDCANNTMALPLHNHMTEADYDYVADTLSRIN